MEKMTWQRWAVRTIGFTFFVGSLPASVGLLHGNGGPGMVGTLVGILVIAATMREGEEV